MSHTVRLTEEAQADLLRLYDFLLEQDPDTIRVAESRCSKSNLTAW
ncbi:hypothetical protein [Castellaniella denitrificans]